MQKFDAVSKSIACGRFIERLKFFKYMDWKAIDPTRLEYVSLGSKPFRTKNGFRKFSPK
jgi:hypothetical protein